MFPHARHCAGPTRIEADPVGSDENDSTSFRCAVATNAGIKCSCVAQRKGGHSPAAMSAPDARTRSEPRCRARCGDRDSCRDCCRRDRCCRRNCCRCRCRHCAGEQIRCHCRRWLYHLLRRQAYLLRREDHGHRLRKHPTRSGRFAAYPRVWSRYCSFAEFRIPRYPASDLKDGLIRDLTVPRRDRHRQAWTEREDRDQSLRRLC
jgi:hypothetical protein